MEFLVGVSLALFCALVVAYPFLKARQARPAGNASPGPASPELEALYQGIRDLSWERQTGEAGDATYDERLDALKRQAAILLRQEAMDRDADLLLEREVQEALTTLSSPRPAPGGEAEGPGGPAQGRRQR